MELIFATNNAHKTREINEILSNKGLIIKNLSDIECFDELPETQSTIVGNALQKARFVATNYGVNCFADDTGLEIDALDGAPGVHSARYAGTPSDATANTELVLKNVGKTLLRTARFRTIIALIIDNQEFIFEGICEGNITETPVGTGGFGYDAIFVPNGYQQTFAEMESGQKNSISHRHIAVTKLVDYLKKII